MDYNDIMALFWKTRLVSPTVNYLLLAHIPKTVQNGVHELSDRSSVQEVAKDKSLYAMKVMVPSCGSAPKVQ